MKRGLVHIYTGNGKGKTTACVGLALRMAGSGGKVLYSFMQKGFESSEIRMLRSIDGIDVYQVCTIKKFSHLLNEDERAEYRKQHEEGLIEISKRCMTGGYDMVVIDEAIGAVNEKALGIDELLTFIKEKPPGCEVVLSGRNAPVELIETADYVSEIIPVRHPFEKGISGRKGIEF
ncbi:MAG: cob(I)yrinic acid a,c-diamide adenosyltransferase [Clostridia bacterium]|nr:cob(I)yrinic acid a,c-diamide adenosyltransferase [Clostridia bacterium]